MRKPFLTLILTFVVGLPMVARADSLWIGTDNTSVRAVLNTDLAGNLIQSVPNTEATGIAVDLASNLIYIGIAENGGQITSRNLATPGTTVSTINPNPPLVFGEDMAFDGTSLWRVDISGNTVDKIDPITGAILSLFNPGFSEPLGVAWDGSNLWVSQFTGNGIVEQFTPSGVPTGQSFNAPLGGSTAGGLAFDTTDKTLFIGTFGNVFHTTTSGALLGSFALPVNDGRFVDGLEFQGTSAVPEPSSIVLLGAALLWIARSSYKKLG